MGGRVVQRKQRIKLFQCFLRDGIFLAHFLRFIQNQDWPVGGDNIDRASGAEFVTLGIDYTRSSIALAAFHIFLLVHGSSKRLGIDNHHIDAGIAGESVQLIQVVAVVNEEPGFLAIMLHKVIGHNLKGLFDALAYSYAWHDHDKLAPAVQSV